MVPKFTCTWLTLLTYLVFGQTPAKYSRPTAVRIHLMLLVISVSRPGSRRISRMAGSNPVKCQVFENKHRRSLIPLSIIIVRGTCYICTRYCTSAFVSTMHGQHNVHSLSVTHSGIHSPNLPFLKSQLIPSSIVRIGKSRNRISTQRYTA